MDTEYAYPVSLRQAHSAPGRFHGSSGRVEGVRVGPGPLTPVERRDGRHLRVVELEVEQREVLLAPAPGHRLREDDVAPLQVPAQRHLSRGATDRLRDAPQHRVVVDLAP